MASLAKVVKGRFASGTDDGCGPVVVHTDVHGGWGGDPAYAGGWLEGHTGHAASMMSEAQMRSVAAALLLAADAIAETGLPSFQQRKRAVTSWPSPLPAGGGG